MSGMTDDQKKEAFRLIMEFRNERQEVRTSLYQYVRKTVLSRPNYVDGKHIRTICDTVDVFLQDPTKQYLVISTPPRHMKSTIISEALPCWYLSNNPQREVIIGSYSQSQARKMCRACRQNFDTEPHRHYFPTYTFDVDTADEFMIHGKSNSRPSLIAAGVGSGLTGSGADLVILDDTVKDYQDATSSTIRENVYNWYQSVVLTRLSPGGKVILVQTRWTYNDLPGVVMEEADPDSVIKLNLPAIDGDGQPLWKERFSIEELEKRKKSMSTRVWNAMYMGRPTPEEGNIFKRDWVRVVYKPFPREAQRVRYWDKAATHDGGDWTVGCLMAMWDGRYCIEDLVRLQGSSGEVQEVIHRTAVQDGIDVAIYMETEPGSSGVDIEDLYSRHILQGFNFHGERITGDKKLRAEPLAAAMENGNVDMIQAPWNRVLLDEITEFPVGSHDDIVDSLDGAFRNLSNVGDGGNIYFF